MKVKVALILFGVLLFNHPFLDAFEIRYHIFYVPVLILGVFAVWAGFIGVLYASYRKEGK